MPQLMTQEKAATTICPHMSRPVPVSGNIAGISPDDGYMPGMIMCHASKCACWEWVDCEKGQLGEREETVAPLGAVIKGWNKSHTKVVDGQNVQVWFRRSVIGPRRGFCGAASDEAAE